MFHVMMLFCADIYSIPLFTYNLQELLAELDKIQVSVNLQQIDRKSVITVSMMMMMIYPLVTVANWHSAFLCGL